MSLALWSFFWDRSVTTTVILGSGSYTVSGRAMSGSLIRSITLASGSYTLSGQVLNKSITRNVILASGAYALTGRVLATTIRRSVTLASGSYILTGRALVPSTTPAGGVIVQVVLNFGGYTLNPSELRYTINRANRWTEEPLWPNNWIEELEP